MVAGEMRRKAWVICEGMGPKDWMYPGIQRGKMGLSRLEQGRLAVSQIFLRGLRMAGWE